MKKRIITAIIMICVVVPVIWLGGPVLSAAAGLLLLASQYELVRAVRGRGVYVASAVAYASGAAGCAAMALWFDVRILLCVASIAVFAACAWVLLRRGADVPALCASCGIIAYPLFGAAAIIWLGASGAERAYAFLLMGILSSMGSDTFAWFFGSRFGKRKLCPTLSPHKTFAGMYAGFAGGAAFIAVFKLLCAAAGWDALEPTWLEAAVCGLAGSAACQVGDLLASAIKRWSGIKDYGSILPGHGGVMDRLDGTYFSCTLMFLMYFIIHIL